MSGKVGASSAAAEASKFKEAPRHSAWYVAIQDLDSGSVMRLLEEDPSRLQQTGPKGCTALHVVVLDCRADLVKKVVRMCHGQRSATSSSSSSHHEDTAAAASFSVQDLVEAVDGSCNETAFGYALLRGNEKIAKTLLSAYQVKLEKYDEEREDDATDRDVDHPREREQLRSIVKELPSILQHKLSQSEDHIEILNDVLEEVREGNEREEYTFHHLCYGFSLGKSTISGSVGKCITNILAIIVEEVKKFDDGCSLVCFLFKLQDGRGNAPLHAVLHGKKKFEYSYGMLEEVLRVIPDECVNARDSAGRTALHVAASAIVKDLRLVTMLLNDKRTDVNATFTPFVREFSFMYVDFDRAWKALMPNTKVNARDLFSDLTALHLAVLNDNAHFVESFLKIKYYRTNVNSRAQGSVSVGSGKRNMVDLVWWTPLQMAVVMGNMEIVQMLLEDDRAYDMGRIRNIRFVWTNAMPALHLAARCGNPELVILILENQKFDPMVTYEGSSALHRAVDATTIDPNFQCVVYFACLDSLKRDYDNRTYAHKETTHDKYSEKKGCVNLLIQAGLDVWSKDSNGYAPSPGLSASKEDRIWWYEKVDNVAKEAKNNLTTATNAISVTAALVATASFVGPLQPPLGNQGGMYIEYGYLSVRIFMVCNCLSFYLAVASIVLSVIPSLPLPQESLQIEFKRIRRTVIVAVSLLLTSLIFVLVSFSAANIAVLPSQWSHRLLTFSASMVGGVVCLAVLSFFTFRLIRLVFYKHQSIRRMYNALAKV